MCSVLIEKNNNNSSNCCLHSSSSVDKTLVVPSSTIGQQQSENKEKKSLFTSVKMIPTLNENEKTGVALICPPDQKSPFKTIFKRGTDMKFRLGFLKRRHTEGTIQGASVRPQPAEAQLWANSFTELLASKYGQSLFKAFLQREFSEENLEFWLAVEDYRKSRASKLNSKAQKIFNDFILPQAPKEVNLDSLTREALVEKQTEPSLPTTFDQAQKRIQGLLEADAYIRFLKSDLYLELIHPEKYSS